MPHQQCILFDWRILLVQYIDESGECYFNYNPNASLHLTWNGKDGGQ